MKRLLVVTLALCAASHPARAYDGATTHVGLTQRAAEAVDLHRLLLQRFGLPLGQFEPLKLSAGDGKDITELLSLLDPADALQPDPAAGLPALSWLLAGSVLEDMPPARMRHHFFDPRTGKGLYDRGMTARLWLVFFGSRELGGPFDLTGRPAPEWAAAKDNDLGLPRLHEALEAAAAGPTAAERQSATARALLCLGAILHLVEDMGSPTHVRNDFRVGHLEARSSSAFDCGSRFEELVAREHGRLGVGPVGGALPRYPRFADYFRKLAERTQRGFFSPGTLPPPQALGSRSTPESLTAALVQEAPFGSPAVRGLRLSGGYVSGEAVSPLAKVVAREGVLELQLDARTEQAYAAALLPQTARTAAGLLAFLLRGTLQLDKEGNITLDGVSLARGTMRTFAENDKGERKELASTTLPPTVAGQKLGEIDLGALPSGTRKVAVLIKAVDDLGEPLILSGQLSL